MKRNKKKQGKKESHYARRLQARKKTLGQYNISFMTTEGEKIKRCVYPSMCRMVQGIASQDSEVQMPRSEVV